MPVRRVLWVTAMCVATATGQEIPRPSGVVKPETSQPAAARTFVDKEGGYEVVLPEGWRTENIVDNSGKLTVEIIYKDRSQSFLKVKSEKLGGEAGCDEDLAACAVAREIDGPLRFRPDFMVGTKERFVGKAGRGFLLNFTFKRAGKATTGRYYFLQTSKDTVWGLRFEGETRFHSVLRYQTDQVAYSFKPAS